MWIDGTTKSVKAVPIIIPLTSTCRSSCAGARGAPLRLRDHRPADRRNDDRQGTEGHLPTCRLDRPRYPLGREVTDDEMANVNLVPDRFHGEWYDTILPSESEQP